MKDRHNAYSEKQCQGDGEGNFKIRWGESSKNIPKP